MALCCAFDTGWIDGANADTGVRCDNEQMMNWWLRPGYGQFALHSTDGFLLVFDGIDAPEGGTLTVDTGVLPLQGGTFASDLLTGTFGADRVPIPGTP